MNKRVRTAVSLLCVFAIVISLLLSCSDPKPEIIAVSWVDIIAEEKSVSIGESLQLTAKVRPDNATDRGIRWESSNAEIASVDNKGLVTGLSAGNVQIKAISTSNSSAVDTVDISVVPVKVESVVVENGGEVTIKKGETIELKAKVNPENATVDGIKWSSNNKAVEVDKSTGVARGIEKGFATITATATYNGNDLKAGTITVYVESPVEKVSFTQESFEVGLNDTINLSGYLEVTPSDAEQTVTWESSNPEIASVENGVVTGKAISDEPVKIKAVSVENEELFAECEVTVKEIPLESISFGEFIVDTTTKDYQIPVVYTPANATYKELRWESLNTDIAEVSVDGKLTIKDGATNGNTFTIKAVSQKHESVSVQKEFTISEIVPQKINLTLEKDHIGKGESIKIGVEVLESNAVNKQLDWSVVPEGIIEYQLSEQGEDGSMTVTVTGARGGVATLTATSKSNPYLSEKCMVTVEVPVEGISYDGETDFSFPIDINKTERELISVSDIVFTPEDATDKGLRVESSNTDAATAEIRDGKVYVDMRRIGDTVVKIASEDGDHEISLNVSITPVAVEEVRITTTGTTTLKTGDTLQFEAKVYPENATNQDVRWESENPDVVKITEDGFATAVASGEAVIRATSKDNPEISDSSTLFVEVKFPVSTISISDVYYESGLNTNKIGLNQEYQLIYTVNPSTAENKNVTWASDKPEIIEVDQNGKIKGLSVGTATITATSVSNPNVTGIKEITVDNPEIEYLEIPEKPIVYPGSKDVQIPVSAYPEIASLDGVELVWEIVNDISFATIDNQGRLTVSEDAQVNRAIQVKVSLKDNPEICSDETTIRVKDKNSLTSIVLNKTDITLKPGDTFQIVPTVYPENAENVEIKYYKSGSGFDVSESGLITATEGGNGKVTVFASTVKGSSVSAVINVIVDVPLEAINLKGWLQSPYVAGIKMENFNETLTKFEVDTNIEFVPSTVQNKKLIVRSDNPEIVNVYIQTESSYGHDIDYIIFEPKQVGETTVRIIAENGGKTIELPVRIVPKMASFVRLNSRFIPLGYSTPLSFNANPVGYTDSLISITLGEEGIMSLGENNWLTGITEGKTTVKADFAGNTRDPEKELIVTKGYPIGKFEVTDKEGEPVLEWEKMFWHIVDEKDGKALLVLDGFYGQDTSKSSDESLKKAFGNSDWENSTIRTYLNGEFIEKTFSEEEQALIVETEIETKGTKTTDKVFLLTGDEYKRYVEANPNMARSFRYETAWTRDCYYLSQETAGQIELQKVNNRPTSSYNFIPAMWINLPPKEIE